MGGARRRAIKKKVTYPAPVPREVPVSRITGAVGETRKMGI